MAEKGYQIDGDLPVKYGTGHDPVAVAEQGDVVNGPNVELHRALKARHITMIGAVYIPAHCIYGIN